MNLNFRKTALLVGVCSAFGLGYTPQLFAASVDTIEAVQQNKKNNWYCIRCDGSYHWCQRIGERYNKWRNY